MRHTLKSLRTEALAWLDEDDTNTSVSSLMTTAMKQAYRELLLTRRWHFLEWPSAVTFSTTPGQRLYTLHNAFSRPMSFVNTSTGVALEEVGYDALQDSNLDWSEAETAGVTRFLLRGTSTVMTQPTAPFYTVVHSSSASDTTAMTLTVTGDTATGIQSETLQCGVQGSLTFTNILSYRKSSNWVGTLTLSAVDTNAVGYTLLHMGPAEYGKTFQVLEFLDTPESIEQIRYRFYRKPAEFSQDFDTPSDIPEEFQSILVPKRLLLYATYNPVEGSHVNVWSNMANNLELALMEHDQRGTSLNVANSHIHYIER
jgi:hypothetical protein